MTMSLLKRTKKCCMKIFRKLSNSNCDASPSPTKKRTTKRIMLGPCFTHPSHKYVQQKNRTPTRLSSRIAPAGNSPEVNENSFNMGIQSNSTTYDDLSYEEDHRRLGFRLNLFRSNFRSRDSSETDDPIQNDDDSISLDQWPICNYEDDQIIFTDNKVYIGCGDNQSFKCFSIRNEDSEERAPGEDSNDGQTSKSGQAELIFKKVNYEKYKQTMNGGELGGSPSSRCRRTLNFNGDDLSPSYRQKQMNQEININEERFSDFGQTNPYRWHKGRTMDEEIEGSSSWNVIGSGEKLARACDLRSKSSEWSSGKYKSVNCAVNEDEDSGIRSDETTTYENSRDRAREDRFNECNNGSDVEVDSWEVLKRKVFEPSPIRGGGGGRGSSNNSLCTLETWIDDECFDNSFNEELERRLQDSVH